MNADLLRSLGYACWHRHDPDPDWADEWVLVDEADDC